MPCALARPRFPRIRAPPTGRNQWRAARVLAAHQPYELAEGSGFRLTGSKPPLSVFHAPGLRALRLARRSSTACMPELAEFFELFDQHFHSRTPTLGNFRFAVDVLGVWGYLL